VQKYAITVHPLNAAEVDWQRLMLDAAYRKAPFQLGEKEKGFRDALILETFLQVVGSTPTSRSIARVALVSGDQLLRDAVAARVGTSGNIHVLESIDALKGLINTLGSSVDEQFITAIRDRAAEAFFKAKDETTLYYKASAGASLNDILTQASVKLPDGADKYNAEKWTINPPRFVKKQGQRIYWTTRFEARLKALKSTPPPQWQTPPSYMLSSTSERDVLKPAAWSTGLSLSSLMTLPSSGVVQPSTGAWSSSPILLGSIDDQFVAFGTASLDVSWSVAVTTAGVLTKLQLESIEFVEVVWG